MSAIDLGFVYDDVIPVNLAKWISLSKASEVALCQISVCINAFARMRAVEFKQNSMDPFTRSPCIQNMHLNFHHSR